MDDDRREETPFRSQEPTSDPRKWVREPERLQDTPLHMLVVREMRVFGVAREQLRLGMISSAKKNS